jgi:CPA2 family monovalent cation:H+ antiporter-2
MHGEFLLEAGVILGVLAAAAWLFLGLRQSTIPAFIVVGMVLQRWVGESEMVEALGTLGVVLLLFFMGLEFSLGTLLRNRRVIVRTGAIDLLVSFPVGLAAGLALGVGWTGALLLAGGFYISSSAIIAKSVIEMRRAADPETSVALGILVFEDLFIALFLAVLSGAVLVADPSVEAAGLGIARALAFFGVVLLVALRAQPLLDRIFDRDNDDLFLLLVGSLVLLLSWAALAAGLSEAIGAFLAGLMLAETEQKERAERLFAPLQGLFAAIFFLAFGLSIDLASFATVWPYAVPLVLLAVAVKLAGGWLAGQRSELSRRGSLALGMMLIARGEFSIILAGIAMNVGLEQVGALLALTVLALSVIGTVAMQFSPEVTRWMFPRRRQRTLEEQGFSPALAAFSEEGEREEAQSRVR